MSDLAIPSAYTNNQHSSILSHRLAGLHESAFHRIPPPGVGSAEGGWRNRPRPVYMPGVDTPKKLAWHLRYVLAVVGELCESGVYDTEARLP